MKHQPYDIRGQHVGFRLHTYNPARREAHHSALLIIICMPAIFQSTFDAIFQIQSINAIVNLQMVHYTGSLFKIQHSHQRVSCLQPIKFVVGIYRIKFHQFHSAKVTILSIVCSKHQQYWYELPESRYRSGLFCREICSQLK